MDLPTFVDLMEKVRGAKLLTRFIARDQRQTVLDLELQIRSYAATVDKFYDRLGDRHWIFCNNFNLEKMTALVAADASEDELEQRFIEETYGDNEALGTQIQLLRRFPAMRPRMKLLHRARADYQEDRYYAVILTLIAVMDGFVNDLDPANRRGLHARDDAELAAWDSVVGHHKGLAAAHRTFTKSFKARIDEPVYELHRNGIVHGNLTDFDNIIVAAKAWNRLFAVADWATAREKEKQPKKREPTWRELGKKLSENARTKHLLDTWKPRTLTAESPEFAGHSVHLAATAFLSAWQGKRYGLMVDVIPLEMHQAHGGQLPREVRSLYQGNTLESFTIEALDFVAASVCVVKATLRVSSTDHAVELRWMYQQAESSDFAIEPDQGVWRLMLWGPDAFLDRSAEPTLKLFHPAVTS